MAMKAQFISIYKYNFHTLNILLDGARKLGNAEIEADLDYGRGSILQIFQHILRASYSWRLGLETHQRQSIPETEEFNHLEGLKTTLDAEAAGWMSLLESLSDEEIESEIELLGRNRTLTIPRWRILQHVAFHGMQHHSELAHLLTERGQSPGDIDYIFFQN